MNLKIVWMLAGLTAFSGMAVLFRDVHDMANIMRAQESRVQAQVERAVEERIQAERELKRLEGQMRESAGKHVAR